MKEDEPRVSLSLDGLVDTHSIHPNDHHNLSNGREQLFCVSFNQILN